MGDRRRQAGTERLENRGGSIAARSVFHGCHGRRCESALQAPGPDHSVPRETGTVECSSGRHARDVPRETAVGGTAVLGDASLSEERAFAGNARASGKPVGTRSYDPQPPHGDGGGHDLGRLEPQLGQASGRPPIVGCSRRVGTHEMAALGEEWRCAFGRHGWAGEPAGGDEVERMPQGRVAAGDFGSLAPHRDPIGQSQGVNGAGQECGAPSRRVEEQPAARRPAHGQHETGHAAARPEVEGERWRSHDDRAEGIGVCDVGVDGTGTQEPERAGRLEDAGQ